MQHGVRLLAVLASVAGRRHGGDYVRGRRQRLSGRVERHNPDFWSRRCPGGIASSDGDLVSGLDRLARDRGTGVAVAKNQDLDLHDATH